MKYLITLVVALLALGTSSSVEPEKTADWFLLEIHPLPDLATIIDDDFYVFEDPSLDVFTRTQAQILNSPAVLETAFAMVKEELKLQDQNQEPAEMISHKVINRGNTVIQTFSKLTPDQATILSEAIMDSYRAYTQEQWKARLMPQIKALEEQIQRQSQALDHMRNDHLGLAQKNGLPIPSQIDSAQAKTLFAEWFEEIRSKEGPDAALSAASQAQSQLDLFADIHRTEALLAEMQTRAKKAEFALSIEFNPITRHAN